MKVENPFKAKLYNYTIPVREELWDAIEKQLPPAEPRRKFPVFWMILFASAMISGALMFGALTRQGNPVKSPDPSVTTTPSEDVSDVTIEEKDNISSSTSSSSTSSSSILNSIASNSTLSNKNSSTSTLNAASANSKRELAASNAAGGSQKASGKSNPSASNAQSSKHRSEASNTATPNSKAQISSLTKSSSPSGGTNPGTPNLSGNHFNGNALQFKTVADASPIGANGNPDISSGKAFASAEAANASLITAKRSTMHSTSLLPLALLDELSAIEIAEASMKKIKPDPSCYKFSGLAGKYYISVDAFGGPGFSPQSFSATGPESTNYIAARNATERNQYAWSAGARVNLHLESGFTLRMGLLYDQAGDVFDYTDTLATQSSTQIDSFFAADGTFLYTETNHVLIFGTLIKKIHNTYRHIDVPLLVSYELPLGHSTLMINAGPVFNLSSSYEGQILDPMLHPRTINTDSSNELAAYKTSLGLSFYFGAGGVFPLTDHISAIVEPRYLYRIKPVTLKSYPLEEHRHFAGLNLGLRYFLN